jgi:HlyD family secretion protein
VEGLERDLQRSLREYDRFLLQHEYALRGYERDRLNLQERVEDAETDLEEARELYRIETISRSELSDAEEAVDDAQDAIQDHEALVEEAVALHELSRQNYEDDIAALREEIDDLRARLAETRVTAPITGRVVSIEDAATVSGELLKQYATILEIADTRDPVIRSEIEEQYVSLIDVGTPVAVEVGGSRRPAAIERIGQFASSSSEGGTPTVELDIAVDSVADELLPGSSALVEVLIGQIDDALVLPRGPYLTSGNRRYLYRIAGERAERIEVEYGTITDERVQIVTGVRPGDRIVTSSYQSFVDKRTITLGGDQ